MNEPGSELNRAVADALGLTWLLRPDGTPVGLYERIPADAVEVNMSDPRVPEKYIGAYSTELRSAFYAAAKVGLFDPDGPEAFLCQHPAAEPTWKVWFEDDTAQDGGHAVYGCTPALAICAAILKLKGAG